MTNLSTLWLILGVLLWARPGSCREEATQLQLASGRSMERAAIPAGSCVKSPPTIQLALGDYAEFTSPNYPSNFPMFTKCSHKFQSPTGTKLNLQCDPVYLTWFAYIFAKDSVSEKRKSCLMCIKSTFNHLFASNTGEVGLDNRLFLTAKGYKCRMNVIPSATTTTTTPRPPSSNPCKCGVPNTSKRIVGGEETDEHQYPWMVLLVRRPGDSYFCGGSLINDRWVLTAAHCSQGTASSIAARLGIHRFSNYPSSALYRPIKRIINHNQHSSTTRDYDVSLLEIDPVDLSGSTYTDTIQPICLPTNNNDYAGVTATVAGWGTTSAGGSSPEKLYKVDVPVVTNTACNNAYTGQITARMICAGRTGKDSCQGDSGGPLWATSSSGNYVEEIGVVSWGRGCGSSGYPGVYTRVTEVRSWILQETAGSTTCSPPS